MYSKNAVAIACGESTRTDVQNKCADFLGDVDWLYVSDKKEEADDNLSLNTINVEMIAMGA